MSVYLNRDKIGELMSEFGLLSLFVVLFIIITGEPAVLTGACRYCLNHYTILAAPTYLWLFLVANVILLGISFYVVLSPPAAKKPSPNT